MKNEIESCWLWPDHVIGKRESRQLRDEHNALVNDHAALLAERDRLREVLKDCVASLVAIGEGYDIPAIGKARAVLPFVNAAQATEPAIPPRALARLKTAAALRAMDFQGGEPTTRDYMRAQQQAGDL
jgi:hypothetical protein